GAGRAAPARRLGRGDACPSPAPLDPAPPRLVLAVPRDRAREATLERRARRPVAEAPDLLGRADVTVDLARPLLDVLLQRRRLPEQGEHELGDLTDGDVDARGNVQDLPRDVLDRRRDD